MRLFISIDFPEQVRKELQAWFPELKGWKQTSIDQMHLTLVFLGECSIDEKDQIHQKLTQTEFSPFTITIDGLGAFPDPSSARIVWAGVQQNNQLMKLQKRISQALDEYIKSKDSKNYIPHITLARKKSRIGNSQIVKQVILKETDKLIQRVESVQLKQSILKRSGSQHEVLHSYF